MRYIGKIHGRPGDNCRHCGDSPKDGKRRAGHRLERPPRNKIPLSKLVGLVRDRLLAQRTAYEATPKEERSFWSLKVTKESLAVAFDVRENEVEQALHWLNLEGLVSQAEHGAPHDSTREKRGFGNDSHWCGDTYTIRVDEDREDS